MKLRRGNPLEGWLGHTGRLFLLVVYAVPLLFLVATSFKSQSDVLADPASLIFTPTLEGYRAVIADAVPALLNSLQIAVGTTTLVLALGVPAAYGLARRRTRGWTVASSIVLGALIILQMVPQPMSVIPLYNVLAQSNLINTIAGVVLAIAALQLPFAMLLLRPFFLAVPRELEEAALLDGARVWTLFARVALPLARNGIVTVGVMIFMLSWGEFIYGTTFLTTADGYPISALLAQQVTLYGTEWGRLMALAVLVTLPILLVFLFGQRRLTEGMLSGAMK